MEHRSNETTPSIFSGTAGVLEGSDGPAAVLLQAAAVPADCAEPVGVAECLVWHHGPGVPLQRCDIRPALHDSFLDKNFFGIEIKIL